MDISLKNIKRVEAHAEALRWQYADRDSQAAALIGAREAYRVSMKYHKYDVPEDEAGPVEAARYWWRRVRVFVGVLREGV